MVEWKAASSVGQLALLKAEYLVEMMAVSWAGHWVDQMVHRMVWMTVGQLEGL